MSPRCARLISIDRFPVFLSNLVEWKRNNGCRRSTAQAEKTVAAVDRFHFVSESESGDARDNPEELRRRLQRSFRAQDGKIAFAHPHPSGEVSEKAFFACAGILIWFRRERNQVSL